MMLWKNRNKRMSVCLTAVTNCLALAAIWTILISPQTALGKAKKPPGVGGGSGNLFKLDLTAWGNYFIGWANLHA